MVIQHWKKIGVHATIKEQERSLHIKRNAANETQVDMWSNDGSERPFSSVGTLVRIFGCHTAGNPHELWINSGGTKGKEPPPRIREIISLWQKAASVPEDERIKLGKEIFKIAADEVYVMGLVGLSPAMMGVRVVKNNMGNIPSRMVISLDGMSPGPSRPPTFFWKK
jgi:peptide/nickel transport system substrate-binding protein